MLVPVVLLGLLFVVTIFALHVGVLLLWIAVHALLDLRAARWQSDRIRVSTIGYLLLVLTLSAIAMAWAVFLWAASPVAFVASNASVAAMIGIWWSSLAASTALICLGRER